MAGSWSGRARACLPLATARGNHLYFRPRTLEEAVQAIARHGGQILSGGTDFFPALGERPISTPIVDVSAVGGLRGISIQPDHIRIGGLTTWTEVIRSPLPRCFDALKSAAREVGSVQIQNRGTVAGNLCNASPAADGVPPLLLLDAAIELVSVTGARRVPLAEFLVGNRKTLRRVDEMLTGVIIPRGLDDARSAFLKLGTRRYLVISIAMVAALVKTDNNGKVAAAHVVVGACSVTAQRLRGLEEALVGTAARPGLGSIVSAEHIVGLSPIDDVRATAAYRKDAALTLVRRALEGCVEAPRE